MLSWLTGSGVVKEEVLEDDREKLAEFYRDAGYIDFELKDVKLDEIDPKHVKVRFVVEEGQQYRVGSVAISGNTNFTSDEIFRGVRSMGKMIKPKMTEGEIFTPKGLIADMDAIRDFYGSKGYIDTFFRPIKNPNTKTATMDLEY